MIPIVRMQRLTTGAAGVNPTSQESERETYDQLARPYDCIVRRTTEPGSCIVSIGSSALRRTFNTGRRNCTDGSIVSIDLNDSSGGRRMYALPKAATQH